MKPMAVAVCLCLLVFGINRSIEAQGKVVRSSISAESSNREQDGLNGPVRRLRVETAKILVKDGKPVEAPHVLREISTYDPKGRKIDSVAYSVEGTTLPGKEQYQYDDRGNIVEMVLRADDGSILSKEKYDYEFDEFGNWKKMTSSVGVYESGKLSYEPVELTYRTISYYYNEAIDRMAKSLSKSNDGSGSAPRAEPPPTKPAAATPVRGSTTEPKIAIKDEATSSRVEPKVKNGEINSETRAAASVAAAPRDEAALKNGHTGTTVAAPSGSSNKAIPIQYVPEEVLRRSSNDSSAEHKNVKLEEGTPVSKIDKQPEGMVKPEGSSAAEAKPPTSRSTSFYETGLSYLKVGRHAEAVVAFRQVVQQNPNDALAYMKLGLAYSGLHQYRETVNVMKMAISIKPEVVDAEAYYQLGNAYTAMGKHSDALKAFTQALYVTRAQAIDSDGTKGQRFPIEQIHYGLGLAYYNLARYKDAIVELKQVIKVNAKSAEAYYTLALAYIAIDDQPSAENQQATLRSLNPALAAKLAEALYRPAVGCSDVLGCRR